MLSDEAFEAEGPETVRHKIKLGLYDPQRRNEALRWLGQKDQERLERSEASRLGMILNARQANTLSTILVIAVIVNTIAATVSAATAIVVVLHRH